MKFLDGISVSLLTSQFSSKVMYIAGRKILFLSILLMSLTMDVAGQKTPPEPNKGPGPPPPGLPIDIGISALIAAGIGLGAYRLIREK